MGNHPIRRSAFLCLLAAVATTLPVRAREDVSAGQEARPAPEYGPVVELTVSAGFAVDLDTGRLLAVPEYLAGDVEALTAWCRETGVDAVGGSGPDGPGLRAADSAFSRTYRAAWDWSPVAAVALNRRVGAQALDDEANVTAPKGFPATYFFRTREGSAGVLQVTGIQQEEQAVVGIRYKAVGPETVSATGAIGSGLSETVGLMQAMVDDEAVRAEMLKGASSTPWHAREMAMGRLSPWVRAKADPRVILMNYAFEIRSSVQSGWGAGADQWAIDPTAIGELDDLAAYPDWQFRTVSVSWTDKEARVVCESTGGGPPGPDGDAVLALDFVRPGEGTDGEWKLADSDLESAGELEEEIAAFVAQHPECEHWIAHHLDDPYFGTPERASAGPDALVAMAGQGLALNVRTAHLRDLRRAIQAYRLEHDGAYPASLDVIYERYLDQDRRLDSIQEEGGAVHLVVPDSDDPDEIVLYSWPPIEGGTQVLFRDGAVQTVRLTADGALINPRTREAVRAAEETDVGAEAAPEARAPVPRGVEVFLITGTVRGEPGGAPMAGVTVRAPKPGTFGVAQAEAVTDDAGRYTLVLDPLRTLFSGIGYAGAAVVPTEVAAETPGYYETNLCRQGRLGLTTQRGLNPADHDVAALVLSGETATVDFVLVPGAQIDGLVEGGFRPSFVDVFGAEPKQTGYADPLAQLRPDKEGRFSVTVRPGPVWFGFGGSSAGEPTSGRVDLDRVGKYALVLEATGEGLLLPDAVQVQVLGSPGGDAQTARRAALKVGHYSVSDLLWEMAKADGIGDVRPDFEAYAAELAREISQACEVEADDMSLTQDFRLATRQTPDAHWRIVAFLKARREAREPREPEPPEAARDPLKRRVTVSFEQTPLSVVIEFLQQVTDVEYVFVDEAIGPAEGNVSITVEARLDEALHQVCESAGDGFGWTIHEGKVVIGKADRLPAPAIARVFPAAETDRTVGNLSQPVFMAFRDTPLAGALEYFQQVTDANFALRRDPEAAVSGRPVTVALETSLGKALDLLCESAGDDIGWAVYGDVVRIGLKEDLSGTDVDPEWPEWQKGLAAGHLDDIVRAPRAEVPPPLSFLDAVTYLSQILPARGLCFFAVRPDFPADLGDVILKTGVPLREALNDLCAQAGIAWAADGPLIRIGTPARLRGAESGAVEAQP